MMTKSRRGGPLELELLGCSSDRTLAGAADDDSLLYDLADGRYPALLIKNFYSRDLCRIIAERISASDLSYFDYGSGIIKNLGIFLMAYVTKKRGYFKMAGGTEEMFGSLFHGMEDPRKKIREVIGRLLPSKRVIVAEENGQRYSCGIIRMHETGDAGSLHRDNAAFDARGFGISRYRHQLSSILYLQQSESGGELVIYDRKWRPEDEKFREIGFGYSRGVISEVNGKPVRHIAIKADAGDLILINPNYFHEIQTVTGTTPRITLGMFFALNYDEPYVAAWS